MTPRRHTECHVTRIVEMTQPVDIEDVFSVARDRAQEGNGLLCALVRACACEVTASLTPFEAKDFLEKPKNLRFLVSPVFKQGGGFEALPDFLARRLGVGFSLATTDDRLFRFHTGSISQPFCVCPTRRSV